MNIHAYLRISTTRKQSEAGGIAVQQREVEELARLLGGSVAAVYSDVGVSGGIPLGRRPQGKRMLAALQAGDVVVASGLDRLFRNSTDALVTFDAFAAKGVGIRTLDLPGDPTRGGADRMMATVKAAMAHRQLEDAGAATRAAMDELKAKGRYQGGNPPFGFRREGDALVPIPGFDAIKAHILRLAAAGTSLRRIAETVTAQHGVKVTHPTVSAFLKERAGSELIAEGAEA